MNILFTGASSFTGFWFAKTLAQSGHQVFCVFTQEGDFAYSGIRGERVRILVKTPGVIPLWGQTVAEVSSRTDQFSRWDVFCSHAAEVGDYKSQNFDALNAVRRNVDGFKELLPWLRQRGCKAVLHSGSYFEMNEGWGEGERLAFSPYALSKGMTWDWVFYYGRKAGLAVGKFVMPNPFGPYEERGFTSYLAKSWLQGETPSVHTPEYIRDNMPVSLMAMKYRLAVEKMLEADMECARFSPTGFVGSQADFTKTFSIRMAKEWGRDCPVNLSVQQDFSEPLARMNSEEGIKDSSALDSFWRDLAGFYKGH